jgi:hypothetical protein
MSLNITFNKEIMKKVLIIVLAVGLVYVTAVFAFNFEGTPEEVKDLMEPAEVILRGGGSTYDKEAINIVGTSASSGASSLTTTTDPITSTAIYTGDTDVVNFNIAYLASTTKNRLHIYPEFSDDNSTWYFYEFPTSTNDTTLPVEFTSATSTYWWFDSSTTSRSYFNFSVEDINTKYLRLKVHKGAGSEGIAESNGELYMQAIKRLTK